MVQPTSGPSQTPLEAKAKVLAEQSVYDFEPRSELTNSTLIQDLKSGVHIETSKLLKIHNETDSTLVDVGAGTPVNLGNLLDLQSFVQLAVVSAVAWKIDPRLALVTIGLAVLYQMTKSLGAKALQELVQRTANSTLKENMTPVKQTVLDQGILDKKIPDVIKDPIQRELINDPVAFSDDPSRTIYDRESITILFGNEREAINPKTREVIYLEKLISLPEVKKQIDDFKMRFTEKTTELKKEVLNEGVEKAELPDVIVDPITKKIINDPVAFNDPNVADPHIYDRESVIALFKEGAKQAVNPHTEEIVYLKDILPLPHAKKQIDDFKERYIAKHGEL